MKKVLRFAVVIALPWITEIVTGVLPGKVRLLIFRHGSLAVLHMLFYPAKWKP